MSSFKSHFAMLSLTGSLFVTGCDEESNTGPETDYDASILLKNISENIISASYSELNDKAQALRESVESLDSQRTDSMLSSVQATWRAARKPWEQSEGFLFGPVDTKGIDPALDSWPVNASDLEGVLQSSDSLTESYVSALEGTLKGFHTIEYLIFGSSGQKKANDISNRELQYLKSVTQSFANSTLELKNSWTNTADGYSKKFSQAGMSGNLYLSQKAALQEIITGMVAICDEVANGKIADPLNQQDRKLEESNFSNNSREDFADNIRSVQNLYLGMYKDVDGVGIEDWVKSFDVTLASQIKNDIQSAIGALLNINPSFGEAIFSNKPSVILAQEKITILRDILEKKLLAKLN